MCNNEKLYKDHTLKFVYVTRWRTKDPPLKIQFFPREKTSHGDNGEESETKMEVWPGPHTKTTSCVTMKNCTKITHLNACLLQYGGQTTLPSKSSSSLGRRPATMTKVKSQKPRWSPDLGHTLLTKDHHHLQLLTPCWIFSFGRLCDYFKKVWNYENHIKSKFL